MVKASKETDNRSGPILPTDQHPHSLFARKVSSMAYLKLPAPGFYLENFFFWGGGQSFKYMDCMGGPAQSAKILQRVHGEI